MKIALAPVLLALVAAVALGSCGESEQDKATKAVCSARADIRKQVDQLKGLTISTATVDAIQQSVQAIRGDLSKIKDAQGDLSDDRRQQVEAANKAFTSQLQSIVEGLGSETSLSGAKSQLTSATQQLATAYQQSFARIDCS